MKNIYAGFIQASQMLPGGGYRTATNTVVVVAESEPEAVGMAIQSSYRDWPVETWHGHTGRVMLITEAQYDAVERPLTVRSKPQMERSK